MKALRIARRCLLASIAIYAAALALGWLGAEPFYLWYGTALASIFAILLGAAACIVLQLRERLTPPPS